jgi:aromatic-L-amino-acid decarboxylase
MTGSALRKTLLECEAKGFVPFYLTATLGTTATCATDRFAEIKAVLAERPSWSKIWVHIDAAYAGAALVTEEWQNITRDFAEGVDSFNMNMHKWLLVNFDASCLFVRNHLDLTAALDITPSYLRNQYSESGIVTDFRNWQIPLGRRFRALKIWFVMRAYGLSGLRKHVRNGMNLGNIFADLVRSRSDLFEIPTKPAFGLTVVKVASSACAGEGDNSNAITKEVYELIDRLGEVFLTSSVVDGMYVIRVVSANERADEPHVRRVFEMLVSTTEDVLAGREEKIQQTNGIKN